MTTAMRALGGLISVERFLKSTDGMAHWPMFTEQEYVERTLRFANVPGADAQGAEAISEMSAIYFELTAGSRLKDVERKDLPDSPHVVANLCQAKRELIAWLEIAQKDPSKATVRLRSALKYAFDHMVIRPKHASAADPFEVHSRYYPDNLEAAFGYALHLILRDRLAPGRRLCRCRYSACRRFFLEIRPSTGLPRRVYCSEAHFEAERSESRAQRMREYRANKRAEAARTQRPK